MMRKNSWLTLSLCCLLSSCSLWTRTTSLVGLGPNEVSSIGIVVASDSVNRYATVVEVAFAYGDASAAVLSSNDHTQWFANRTGYCSAYGSEMDVMRWEIPSGYTATATSSSLPKKHKLATAVRVFARLSGNQDITDLKTPWIFVGEQEFSVTETPPGATKSKKLKKPSIRAQYPC